jgi:SAM-dependent methyltransferase
MLLSPDLSPWEHFSLTGATVSKLSTFVRRITRRQTAHPANGAIRTVGSMNKLLLSAYWLRQLRRDSGRIELHLLSDEPEKYSDDECRRILSPWSDWAEIRHCGAAPDPKDRAAIGRLNLQPGSVVVAMVSDPASQAVWQTLCEGHGVRCIVPQLPDFGTLDHDFVREVSFFDSELGGKNEWLGSPTLFSPQTLRQISRTNCREYYPAWATRQLLNGSQARPRPLKILDIGSGPISVLRWGAIQGEISITGVDPLLNMYALVLARHGLDTLPKIRCDREIVGFGEDLDELLPDDKFDMVYSQNALDHTQQPMRVIEQISRHLAPHGIAVIQVATREGTRRKWDQLHKTDIFLKDSVLMFAHQHTSERPLLSPESGLSLKLVECYTPDWLACVLERKQAA